MNEIEKILSKNIMLKSEYEKANEQESIDKKYLIKEPLMALFIWQITSSIYNNKNEDKYYRHRKFRNKVKVI